jgi:uncharacterized tellurite resistance protein B-like protein
MKYNGIQMSAIIRAGIAMITADGKIEDAESNCLTRELVNFGVTPEDLPRLIELSKAMEPVTMIATLSSMTEAQKKYVSGFLATIMVSDGDIDESEVKLWQLISTLIGCPTMNLNDALNFWKEN